jgi:hypothetical protein
MQPLGMRLDGPQSRTELSDENNFFKLLGIKPRVLGPTCNLFPIPTDLSRTLNKWEDFITYIYVLLRGGWRKLHNEELHNLYSSPSIIRIIKSKGMRLAEHVARMGIKRNSYRILEEESEGKISLGRLRRRWEDNIKMDFREIGWGDMDWIDLAQDMHQWRALINTVMNLQVP